MELAAGEGALTAVGVAVGMVVGVVAGWFASRDHRSSSAELGRQATLVLRGVEEAGPGGFTRDAEGRAVGVAVKLGKIGSASMAPAAMTSGAEPGQAGERR